ncbi:YraN family protein [Antribacter gilvus]|uniref:YraN family protein n=1 Tax=Antribacter gilvus TaxID=2304675 RepID=UPI000F7666C0|nr:YraN family protein [Antribacter gilvus]
MRAKDGVGKYGEAVAARHVAARGWPVLDRNWRGKGGELDLVAIDGDLLVVIEVKTRSGTGFGHPAEGVTARKLARLRVLAGQYLSHHRLRCADGADVPVHFAGVRIDVVAVTLPRAGAAVVEHLEGVV